MSYAPGIEDHRDRIIAGAGQAISETLQKALQNYEENKRKAAFADTVFDHLKNVPGAISPEALDRYHKANGSQKYEMVVGAASNATQIAAQQAQTQAQQAQAQNQLDKEADRKLRWDIANLKAAPDDPNALTPQPLVAADGTVIKDQYVLPKTGAVIYGKGRQNSEDSWHKLNKDIKERTGIGILDWNNASIKKGQEGEFVGVVGGITNPRTGERTGGKVYKIPSNTYQEFLGRFRKMQVDEEEPSGAATSSAAAATPAPAPVSSPPSGGAAAKSGSTPIKSKEEYDALPKGALYQAPDGSMRRKP